MITLQIIKRAGENLIETSQKVKAIVAEMQESGELPPPDKLNITFTGDQSIPTETSFRELINTIVIRLFCWY